MEVHHYPAGDIPATRIDDVPVRVMMGSAYGLSAPVKTFADTLYIEAHLQAGDSLTLPESPQRALYVVSGQITLDGIVIAAHHMAVLSSKPGLKIAAQTESRIALIGGEPVGERFIEWNFVSSRKERIAQAADDWQARRFPAIPEDNTEFIPLPE